MSVGRAAASGPPAVQVLSLLLLGLILFRLAGEWLREGRGIRFVIWLQYTAAALASLLLGGYVFASQRWMFLCGLVALIPAFVSGLFNVASGRLPR